MEQDETRLFGGKSLPDRSKNPNRDTRAMWVKGCEISSQIITIALELVLPGLLGFLADRWLRIFPVLSSLGMLFGFAAGTLHFIHFAKTLSRSTRRTGSDHHDTSKDTD